MIDGRAAEGEIRCWWCGAEPYDVHTIQAFGGPVTRLIPLWPTGDHRHEITPPTPQQLVEHGHQALLRIIQIMSEGAV